MFLVHQYRKLVPKPSETRKASLYEDEKEQFLPQSKENPYRDVPGSQRPRRSFGIYLTAVNGIIFVASAVLAILSYNAAYTLRRNHNNALIRTMDFYSPVHDQASIPIIDVKINGSLLNMNDHIFRQPPSPEVDEAWERIGSLMPHVISTEDVIRLGKDPARTARWPEDWGFGPDAHIAELDILHTLHCLNAIRKDIHWRYYYKDRYPDGVFPELHRVHTDHCIYIVLQNLMCGATADIITQDWVDGQLHPFPDFNINKKCRDFNAILDWHEATMIDDMPRFAKMRMPEGHIPYAMSDEFHRMFGTDPEGLFWGHDHH